MLKRFRFRPFALEGAPASAALVAVLAIGSAILAFADDFRLRVGRIEADTAFVRVSFELSDPLPESDSEGPTGTTPAALAYTIELWRERANWFDSIVSSRTYGFRLDYDHLRNLYRVVTPEGEILEVADRGTLVSLLCFQDGVVGGRTRDLEPGRQYYFAVTARLTPIDLNELGEIEDWMSGEIQTGTRRDGILGVPKAVLGMLANLAGFGDRSVVERSNVFYRIEPGSGIAVIDTDDGR
jgi:hypothetical protein